MKKEKARAKVAKWRAKQSPEKKAAERQKNALRDKTRRANETAEEHQDRIQRQAKRHAILRKIRHQNKD